jgi:TrmH family RNA methyltransferase
MGNLPPLSLNRQKSIRRLGQKKYRKSENAYLCEGFRLLDTALKSTQTEIREIILSTSLSGSKLEKLVLEEGKKRNIPLFSADEKSIRTLSDEVTPSGLIFTVSKSVITQRELEITQSPVILYLDRITDPGNMGTILRSAVWFGIRHLVLSPGCVDPFNPKAVRASAGALFEIGICPEIEFSWLRDLFKQKKYQFIATVAGNGIPLHQWQIKAKSLIFFGQEAEGLSAQILEAADLQLTIPGTRKTESLNLSVAAGIILYEIFSRQT